MYTEYGCWKFAKQETSFDEAVRATRIFDEYQKLSVKRKKEKVLEDFFREESSKYNVRTERHRVLSVAQMFGLITKKKPYKYSLYEKEEVTEVYKKIKNTSYGSEKYNVIKSEQLLKVKMRAITDTKSYCEGWNVYPILFLYKVLEELRKNGVDEITVAQFWGLVATNSSMNNIAHTVENIQNMEEGSPYIEKYKNLSRLISLFSKNLCLFEFRKQGGEYVGISINGEIASRLERFLDENTYAMFLEKFEDEKKYGDFLTYVQGFRINLIDKNPTVEECIDEENIYDRNVESAGLISDEKLRKCIDREPEEEYQSKSCRCKTNPGIAKTVIVKTGYKCFISPENHLTFKSNTTKQQYMEAHHLIPISYYQLIWNRFLKHVDCEQNIVSLCPNCHRKIHYGTSEEKKEILDKIYDKRRELLSDSGIEVSKEELYKFYKVN